MSGANLGMGIHVLLILLGIHPAFSRLVRRIDYASLFFALKDGRTMIECRAGKLECTSLDSAIEDVGVSSGAMYPEHF